MIASNAFTYLLRRRRWTFPSVSAGGLRPTNMMWSAKNIEFGRSIMRTNKMQDLEAWQTLRNRTSEPAGK